MHFVHCTIDLGAQLGCRDGRRVEGMPRQQPLTQSKVVQDRSRYLHGGFGKLAVIPDVINAGQNDQHNGEDTQHGQRSQPDRSRAEFRAEMFAIVQFESEDLGRFRGQSAPISPRIARTRSE